MNYKQKRNNKRLDTYTVSKLLGIDEKTYIEVERGYRNLEGNLIDKFMDIMDNAKEIRFNNKQLEQDIDDWIESGEAKEDIKRMGYEQIEIAEKLNTSPSMISKTLLHPNNVQFNTKYKLYDFVKNPLNKNIEDVLKEEKGKSVIKEIENTEKNVIEKQSTEMLSVNQIETLQAENERLRKQLERYEKLIDRLG